MKLPFYFDVDIEWGHFRLGPLVLTWFNSDAAYDSWGSVDISWKFKYCFLFAFNELKHAPHFHARELDPEITAALRGSKEL